MSVNKEHITICPVCKTENSRLSLTCISCGGYIQDRVASLHLFQTLWMLIETPFSAMHRIIVAQQKNYIYLLQMMFGIAYVAFVFWFSNIGILIDDLQTILVLILVLGPVTGIVVVTVLSMITTAVLRVRDRTMQYRDIRAVLSYACFPVIVSVVFIFPVEVGLFGMQLFTGDPSPFEFNPVLYSIILGLDAVFIIWSILLLYIGVRVITGISGVALVVSLVIIVASLLPVFAVSSIISLYGAL